MDAHTRRDKFHKQYESIPRPKRPDITPDEYINGLALHVWTSHTWMKVRIDAASILLWDLKIKNLQNQDIHMMDMILMVFCC